MPASFRHTSSDLRKLLRKPLRITSSDGTRSPLHSTPLLLYSHSHSQLCVCGAYFSPLSSEALRPSPCSWKWMETFVLYTKYCFVFVMCLEYSTSAALVRGSLSVSASFSLRSSGPECAQKALTKARSQRQHHNFTRRSVNMRREHIISVTRCTHMEYFYSKAKFGSTNSSAACNTALTWKLLALTTHFKKAEQCRK